MAGMVFSGDRARSHAAIDERARRAAAGFAALGVREGDAVALLLRNDFAFFEATIAAGLLGAYVTPINWHFTATEIADIARDCGARIAVAHADLAPMLGSALGADAAILIEKTPPELSSAFGVAAESCVVPAGYEAWDAFVARYEPYRGAPRQAPQAMLYTSGTTGRPKGVRRVPQTAEQVRKTRALRELFWGLAPGNDARVLVTGPMYHAAPGVHAQVALQAGLEIHLQPRFDAEDTLRRIARDRISHFHLVPTMMSRLLRLPEEVKWRYDVSAIRHVTHGAAPCPIDVKNALLDWWGPVLHEYYGSTETSVVCWATPEDARMRPGTVGKALPEMEVRIFDDARRALPPRAIGEVGLHNKLAANFIYHRDEEKRKEVAAGDFVLTGDVGWLDEDGYLFLCDRKRDMVIVGGSNVYPAEIEMILATMPGVYDSAVFGIPDDDLGEVLAALVQPEMGVALDEHSIREFLVPRVARFKLPRRVVITDALPREDTGKIFKRKLRDAYWAGRSRKI